MRDKKNNDIEILIDKDRQPFGFKKLSTNSYYQLSVQPLTKSEIDWYQKEGA